YVRRRVCPHCPDFTPHSILPAAHTCEHTHTHTHTLINTHTHTHTQTQTPHIHTQLLQYMRQRESCYISTYAHTGEHTHASTHTHTQIKNSLTLHAHALIISS